MFKAGDRVVISEPDGKMGGPGFVGGMEEFCGKVLTVQDEVGTHPDDGGWYELIGGGGYLWAGNWMKKVNKFKGNK